MVCLFLGVTGQGDPAFTVLRLWVWYKCARPAREHSQRELA
jgi:hypothetical protein